MSTEPKPPKPMPSADEINAYLELSAARTKLRLPLAKGAARVDAAPAAAPAASEKLEKRELPISKKLPTQHEPVRRDDRAHAGGSEAGPGAVWRPFASDDES
jgi:hypothetical protein